MRFRKLLWRALRLRCPMCGEGKLFRGWFAMHTQCPACEADLTREEGFYLGSIYANYGLTTLVIAVAYPLLLFNRVASNNTLMLISLAFMLLFPLWFFRYARSLWLGFDQLCDPQPGEIGTSDDARESRE